MKPTLDRPEISFLSILGKIGPWSTPQSRKFLNGTHCRLQIHVSIPVYTENWQFGDGQKNGYLTLLTKMVNCTWKYHPWTTFWRKKFR